MGDVKVKHAEELKEYDLKSDQRKERSCRDKTFQRGEF
jgi:hypothetical protein